MRILVLLDSSNKISHSLLQRAQLAKAEVLQIHHGASDSAASICSLYLFDAASRHAKDVVRKNGAGLDPVKVLPSTKQAGDPKAALISAAKEFLSEMSTIVMEVTEETARMASAEQKVSLSTLRQPHSYWPAPALTQRIELFFYFRKRY